jgi:hypothetical protein
VCGAALVEVDEVLREEVVVPVLNVAFVGGLLRVGAFLVFVEFK